jgi:two-component system, cell cycle sensor histidine kinase and response regulator CckA
MINRFAKTEGFLARIVAGIVALNLFIIMLAGIWSYKSRLQYESRAHVATQNLTLVLEQSISGVIKTVEVALNSLRMVVEKEQQTGRFGSRELEAYLDELHHSLPELEGLRVSDARGRLLYGFRGKAQQAPDISDREYFLRLRQDPTLRLVLSKPIRGRIGGKWIIVIAKPLRHPDGSFAGVVFGALPLDYLSALFSSIDVGTFGALALREAADLSLVARYPEPKGDGRGIGSQLMSRQFLELQKLDAATGTYDGRSGVDRRERTWTYRRFADRSYYIFAGMDRDEYLAPWRRELVVVLLLVASFALASLAGFVIIRRGWSRNNRALGALAESESRERKRVDELNAIMESVPVVLLIAHDTAGRQITGNPLACALLQIPSGGNFSKRAVDGAGTGHYVILHGEVETPPRDLPLQRAIRGESVRNYRQEIVFDDGHRVTLFGDAVPLRDDRGEIRGAVAAFLDVTTQLKTSGDLLESEARYRTLFDQSPDGIALVDPDSFALDIFNEAACQQLGYSREEFARLTVRDLDPLEDLELIRERGRTLRETGSATFETIHLTKDGAPRNIEVHLKFVTIGGKPLICSIFHDITKRTLAETALRASEERFRTLVETSTDVIFVLNGDGVFQFVSPAWEQHYGFPVDGVIGCHFGQFVHPDDALPCAEYLSRVLASGVGEASPSYRVKHAGGSWRSFISNGTSYTDAAGVRMYIGVSRDISEQLRSEEERIEIERKLLHSQKLESLGVLAGGIAHDFNNLLAAILGNLDLAALRLPEMSPVRGNLEQSMLACRRAADLTRQMLAYCGKGIFQLEQVNLNAVVRENADLFKAVVPCNVKFSLDAPDQVLPIMVDPSQVQQVVMNLITNAVEAIGEGHGTVSLRTGIRECDARYIAASRLEEKPLPGHFAFIEVTDDGCGMDEETQRRLFEPFFTTKFTGRGLGMAATQGIITKLKGLIVLKSSPGGGTSFCVLLPALGAVAAAQVAPVPAAGPVAALLQGGQGKVLVVDDEDVVREVGCEYVRLLGFEVLEARDGVEALEVFRRHQHEIAFLILDMAMPNLDGVATFHELKKIRPEVKVIVSSGFSEQSVLEQFPQDRPDAFLQKPFQVRELEQQVARVLAQDAPAGMF